jgi:hypothetical protein
MITEQSDFILLIFNCKRYRYKALKQKETWLKDFTLMPYFHVIGEPDLDIEYKLDFINRILYVKVNDDYNSLPKKVIAAYSAINNIYTFKYIFKTDDDQNLTNIRFLETTKDILLQKIPKIHYGGYVVNVDQPYLSQYNNIHPELPENLPILETQYCSGRFYLLSHNAVTSLLIKKDSICEEFLEDYAIGYHMPVAVYKENILRLKTEDIFFDYV